MEQTDTMHVQSENTEREHEAPVVEVAEPVMSPEKQVEQAMADAEAVKRAFDPAAAEVEFSKNRDGYVSRLGAPDEAVASADIAIGGDLSEIRQEEAGALEKLNATLRKYAGIASLVFVAGVASAEGQSGADTESVRSGHPDVGLTVKQEGLPDTGGQQDKAAFNRAVENRIAEGSFESEGELIGFLRTAAEKYPGECYVLYGVDAAGKMNYILGSTEYQKSKQSGAEGSVLVEARKSGAMELREIHTHPTDPLDDPTEHANGANFPPSIGDIRSSSALSWLDKFDNPTLTDSSAYGTVMVRQFVVTEKGLWEYGVDWSNEYVRGVREESLRQALDVLDFGRYDITPEDAEAYFRILQTSDPYVLEREERFLEGKGVAVQLLRKSEEAVAVANSSISFRSEDDDFTAMQSGVIEASKNDEATAIAEYIGFCKENGILMKYSPLSEKSDGSGIVDGMIFGK